MDVVGGNDPPISTFPPVEIEKDAAHRNSKCNSSSSESGSSSSGSCYCVHYIYDLRIVFKYLILGACNPCFKLDFSSETSSEKKYCKPLQVSNMFNSCKCCPFYKVLVCSLSFYISFCCTYLYSGTSTISN